MCFVLGLYLLPSVANTGQLAWSSHTVVGGSDLQALVFATRLNLCSLGLMHLSILVVFLCNSVINVRMGMPSLMHVLNATYSLSVVESGTSDCILLAHRRGQFMYIKIYPDRDSTDSLNLA